MNKKGFTLIELLATITILALLTVVASTSVTKVLKESKGDLYKTQEKLIESAAKNYVVENMGQLPNVGECKFVTIKNLQDYGFIDKDISNPKTGSKIDNNIKIKITVNQNGYGYNGVNYEINPNSTEGCSHFKPCVLLSGKNNEIGSKYECEVKTGTKYNFYVISHEEDGTTNLIMEQNINNDGTPATERIYEKNETNEKNKIYNFISWNSTGNNMDGPVEVINFLYNATKTWDNIPALNYYYYDRNFNNITTDSIGYTSFISINGVSIITSFSGNEVQIGTQKEPLRARLPIYTKNSNNLMYNEVMPFDGTNIYLYEYLSGDKWNYDESTKPSNVATNVKGYYTLSSYYATDDTRDYHSTVCSVNYMGGVSASGILTDAGDLSTLGVRPVINVKL